MKKRELSKKIKAETLIRRKKLEKIILRDLKIFPWTLLILIAPIWFTIYEIDILEKSEKVSVTVVDEQVRIGYNSRQRKNEKYTVTIVAFFTANGVRHVKTASSLSFFNLSKHDVVDAYYYAEKDDLYGIPRVVFFVLIAWMFGFILISPFILTYYCYYYRYEYLIELYSKHYQGRI